MSEAGVAVRLLRVAFSVLVVGCCLASAQIAFGFFTTQGQGSGESGSGTMQPVTVSALVGGDVPSTTLRPGGTADVILRVSNPNSYAVTIVSVAGNGPMSASGGQGTCTTSGVTFAGASGLAVSVAASATVLVRLAGAASMDAASPNGCQRATFSIPVAVVATSS